MPKTLCSTEISERIARRVFALRLARGWTRQVLSIALHDHRCPVHPHGFAMSAAVVNTIENGVPAQHGHPARARPVTSDEHYVLAEVLGVSPEELAR